ncbi:thioredoxin reductase [Stackebrandtia endophytica]|uniref:Thioredoxin reductase n=1 Tax=Stackebrandtia endophytica TaxID=1496996 RepID=A0A543AYY7_9ACTN|nr:thioredoxin reductase [Stackebrandtia endophytica]
MTERLSDNYEAVVIGGGAAGLNGALMLARMRRSVLVIDAGQPRNAPSPAVHGLLARDGMSPAELLERGRSEVRGYGGVVMTGEVDRIARSAADDGDPRFTVTLADGRSTVARRLLVASGLTDELPDIPGLREQWGRDVVHCPFCHGWEVRDRVIGVLATTGMAVHQATLFRQLSDDVVFFANTVSLSNEDAARLAKLGVRVVEGVVSAVETDGGGITGVRLDDSTVVPCEVVTTTPRMVARAGFLADLGLVPVEHPAGVGPHLTADTAGRTEVPGVWAAGNVTDPMAQVGASAAAGAAAGAQIAADLGVR